MSVGMWKSCRWSVVRCRWEWGRVVGDPLSVVGGAAARCTDSSFADNRQQTTDNGQRTTLMIVNRFEDLDVYQKALGVQREIFHLSKLFPKEERYSLTDQIRRSSRSVGANIAEAWHKRRYPAHFTSKLTDADAESAETRHWLQTGFDCEYLTE